MKTLEVNVIPEIISSNTQLISKVGANVGTQIFKVEVRMAWQGGQEGFEKDKRAIETGEKKGFILNRSPRRLLAKNILIAGVCLVKDVDDDICIAINPHENGTADMLLPINDKTLDTIGKTTQDAIKEAIRGEKDHFFLDGKTLVQIINGQIKKEIEALESLTEDIKKMINTLKGDMSSNENKAKAVQDAWINSALPADVHMPSGATGANATIVINKED